MNFILIWDLGYDNLGSYDLLDLCINGPKEKLDSTVISQVTFCQYEDISSGW